MKKRNLIPILLILSYTCFIQTAFSQVAAPQNKSAFNNQNKAFAISNCAAFVKFDHREESFFTGRNFEDDPCDDLNDLFLANEESMENRYAAPITQMIPVNGHQMHVQTYGLNEQWHEDIPTVVFENGALSPLESWGKVPSQVASFAPVVTYDRSTIGKSEWDGKTGTPAHVTKNLWALLEELDISPPYVLVGWSWGGDLVRYHAGTHPEDIAGLVFVDPAAQSPKASLSILETMGYSKKQYDVEIEARKKAFSKMPENLQADVKVISQMLIDEIEPNYGTIPSVPTAVLLAGKYRPPSAEELKQFGDPPYDIKTHFEAKLRSRIKRTSEWTLSSPEGLFVVARNSGHAIQLQEPDLVTDAIHRMGLPDPSRQLHNIIATEGTEAFQQSYQELKQYYPKERFSEGLLNNLGYQLLRDENIEEAIAVFKLNTKEYPKAANPYDSLGDAYRAANKLHKARESYAKAVELTSGSGPSQAKLEQVIKQLERQ